MRPGTTQKFVVLPGCDGSPFSQAVTTGRLLRSENCAALTVCTGQKTVISRNLLTAIDLTSKCTSSRRKWPCE